MERWRPEINTFHMYHGEMAIMLEDVSFITGLPVDGAAVFEKYPDKDYDWGPTIFRIFGETSSEDDHVKDGRLKLTWLRRTFKDPSKISSSDELQLKQYARAYALACIGSFLMADRSGSGATIHPVPPSIRCTYYCWSESDRLMNNILHGGLRCWRSYTERCGAQFSTWRLTEKLEAT
ncbi:Serine/threonine-protein phosphatase 7 long form homolog [Linum grandiflorum]